MSNYDWEEVKKLAADFRRAQLTSSAQRLSEKNCVEIVTKLVHLKLLDVVFTNDGKSYITPKYLIKEIRDELHVHGGRVNLIDVAKLLNVDFNVINTLAHDIIKEDTNVRIILGQLIDHSYAVHVAEEINDRLQQHGIISVTELARTFDLPGDFIHSVIKENTGRIIVSARQDKQDAQSYYTESFLNQNKAVVRGAFIAITKPTLISTIISHCGIKENVLFSLIDSLIESKQIPGVLTERIGNVCTYIPQIYLKTQSEWVNNFFQQNGYLEYDALNRVGINDPKGFIAKSLKSDEKLFYLQNCAVGQQLLDQIEATIEEVLASRSWTNILNVLPTVIDTDDAEILLKNVTDKQRFSSSIRVFNHSYAVSDSFLNKIQSNIAEKIIPENVDKMINSGKYEQYVIESKLNNANDESEKRELSRKEERKKRTNVGKSGGGTQGRETKTRVTKKKYGQKSTNKADSDEEESKNHGISIALELVTYDEIRNVIELDESFQDESDDCADFIEELLQYFYPSINKTALSLAQSAYETRLANLHNTKRKMNAELQDSIISTYQNLKHYYKGIKEFNDAECQLQLSKYLLKSTGTQLINTCFTFISDKNEDISSTEARNKVLSTIDNKELKETFVKLNKSVGGNSVDEFMNAVEDALAILNIMMKKMDKKKEKTLLESHRQALIEKLKETEDPPLVLHLVLLILFQNITQNILNASGRFVSNILSLLGERIDENNFAVLQQYHGNVLKLFKLSEDDEDYVKISEELKEVTEKVKQMALTFSNK
ncbi:E3 UFM1-protein ligase 1 homolog isoform X2 [Planococcus citri]